MIQARLGQCWVVVEQPGVQTADLSPTEKDVQRLHMMKVVEAKVLVDFLWVREAHVAGDQAAVWTSQISRDAVYFDQGHAGILLILAFIQAKCLMVKLFQLEFLGFSGLIVPPWNKRRLICVKQAGKASHFE